MKKDMSIKQILESIDLLTEEISRNKSFCQPAVLPEWRQIPVERRELYSTLGSKEYGMLVEKILHCDLEKAHVDFDKRYKKDEIKRFVKKFIPWK